MDEANVFKMISFAPSSLKTLQILLGLQASDIDTSLEEESTIKFVSIIPVRFPKLSKLSGFELCSDFDYPFTVDRVCIVIPQLRHLRIVSSLTHHRHLAALKGLVAFQILKSYNFGRFAVDFRSALSKDPNICAFGHVLPPSHPEPDGIRHLDARLDLYTRTKAMAAL